MSTFRFVKVPSLDVLFGIIYGHYRDSKNSPSDDLEHRRLFYIDVTAEAAESAIYSAIKKQPIKAIIPTGYIPDGRLRGFTSGPTASIVLSPNLMHVSPTRLAENLCEIFSRLHRCGSTRKTEYNIYLLHESEDLIDIIQNYYIDTYSQTLKADKLEPNMTMAHVLEFSKLPAGHTDRMSYPSVAVFGDGMLLLDSKLVASFVTELRKVKVDVKLHPDLYYRLVRDEFSYFK